MIRDVRIHRGEVFFAVDNGNVYKVTDARAAWGVEVQMIGRLSSGSVSDAVIDYITSMGGIAPNFTGCVSDVSLPPEEPTPEQVAWMYGMPYKTGVPPIMSDGSGAPTQGSEAAPVRETEAEMKARIWKAVEAACK